MKLYLVTLKRKNLFYTLFGSIAAILLLFLVFLKFGPEYIVEDIASMPSYYNISDSGTQHNHGDGGKLAIIIDDFGQSREGVKEMMSIHRHITFAIMPFLEFSKQDAEEGYMRGHEIIVHLSMEPERGQGDCRGNQRYAPGV